nr:N-acetylcysteine deacetylase [uncultured bacterium]
MTTRALVDGCFPKMVEIRRALHATPELAFEEHATTTLIRDRLRMLGSSELSCPTPTGAIFAIDGGNPGRTVLLRADIDALPVHEEVELPFRSRVDGVMHACGHDAHVAMMLGVAEVIAARADTLPGRYVFLFQPAEEHLAGARAMIDAGVLESMRADHLIGCHVASILPTGIVFLRSGVTMAEGQGLRFEIRGPGGHGALPGASGDVVAAVGELVRALPAVVDGLEHERARCACSAGVIRAGTALNVLPSSAVVEGTLRTFTESQHRTAIERLQELCRRIADQRSVTIELALTMHAPAVINDAHASDLVQAAATEALGSERVISGPPLSPSDDVSEFLRRVPGCFFLVGAARGDGSSGMHHSPAFAIEEEAMRTGAVVMANGAIALATPT